MTALTRRIATILPAAILTAATLAGCGRPVTSVSSLSSASTAQPAQSDPADTAQAAVERFLGVQSLPRGNWVQRTTPGGSRLHAAIPNVGTFEVDLTSDTVTEAVIDGSVMADGGGKSETVTMQAAEQTAAQFARAHAPEFSNLTQREESLVDHGAFKTYLFTWQEKQGLAWVPTYVQIGVNPSANLVSSYATESVPVTIGTTPSVSAAQAQQDAIEGHLVGQVSAQSDGLNVAVDPDGSQRLVWIFELTVVHQGQYVGLAPGDHVVYVDALTGSVQQVAG
jgi:hypothetical protein